MLKRERQEFILHQIDLHNKVLSTDLSQKLNVSDDTVRRDLNELAEFGKLLKVHGGAISKSFRNSFQHSNIYSLENKKIIAQKAAALIQDGMFVLTSGGTTIIELARSLPENLQATFITGSLQAAYEYVQHPNIEVILIGDRISRSSQLTVGADAVAKIKQFNADLCFLGINAIDTQHGLTDSDWEVAQVKKAMIEQSAKVVALAISEKLNTTQKIQVCDLSNIDILITELQPDAPPLEDYKIKKVEVI
jgi:DeoR/GlpR family transcriptional regulator of sugar metabolism